MEGAVSLRQVNPASGSPAYDALTPAVMIRKHSVSCRRFSTVISRKVTPRMKAHGVASTHHHLEFFSRFRTAPCSSAQYVIIRFMTQRIARP
jgi:hypothetical protein